MRKYLVTIVFKPEAKKDEVVKVVKDLVSEEGKVESEEELSLKKLAYEIAGTTEADFYQLAISGPASLIKNITDELRVSDQVLRFLIKSAKADAKKEAGK